MSCRSKSLCFKVSIPQIRFTEPLSCRFCRELFVFAASCLVLPCAFWFCRELFAFAVSFCFCSELFVIVASLFLSFHHEVFDIAVTVVGHRIFFSSKHPGTVHIYSSAHSTHDQSISKCISKSLTPRIANNHAVMSAVNFTPACDVTIYITLHYITLHYITLHILERF